jgi:hypothetical protein
MLRYRQRHYDYVLGPNQVPALASIAPGQQINGIPLLLDSDAPFLLRGRALRTTYPFFVEPGQVKLQANTHVLMRYTDANGNYLSDSLVRQGLEMVYYGQQGQWRPVSPQVLYPPKGNILVDILNDDRSHSITNLTLYFRGVKLYPWDARPKHTYPRQFEIGRASCRERV